MTERQKAMEPMAPYDIALCEFNDLLDTLKAGKPNDRSEQDRYYAIAITEVEKAKAIFAMYCKPEG